MNKDVDLTVQRSELEEFFAGKYGGPAKANQTAKLRYRFGCFSPDDFYELITSRLVDAQTAWIDVGCGRNIFPSNAGLARKLAAQCKVLVGVDPDVTLEENQFVHRRIRGDIAAISLDEQFDLITLRMVAEHVVDPAAVLASLARLTRVGGHVVIYTVNKWSPASIVAKLTPMGVHHTVKRYLWRTEEKDTFPVAYKMNTRATLRRQFESHGFAERHFVHIDDTRTTSRFYALQYAELAARRLFRLVGLRYPENCLLGVYQRVADARHT